MNFIARMFVLGSLVLLGAYYGPALLRLIAAERLRVPAVFYSADKNDFLFFRYTGTELERTDSSGQTYERADFEALLPLMHAAQLIKDNRMPDKIAGWTWNPAEARHARISLRLRSWQQDTPGVPLYPLFDGESGRVRLEVPDDFVRLGNTAEIVHAGRNEIIPEDSIRLRALFDSQGFVFPVRLVGGNPTTLKPYDEGYYLLDSAGDLFHLQKRRTEIHLERIPLDSLPGGRATLQALDPVFLLVVEHENRLLRLVVMGRNGEVFALVGPDRKWQRLDLQNYNPSKMDFGLRADPLNFLVTINGSGLLESVALRRDFSEENRHIESLPALSQTLAGRWIQILFPFVWELESPHSGFLTLQASPGRPASFAISITLAVAATGIWIRRRQWTPSRFGDLFWITIGGLVGLLAVLLLKSR